MRYAYAKLQPDYYATVELPVIALSCTDVILLFINLFGEKDMNMQTFREIFPECGYSHDDIRFNNIPDRLVQGKKNILLGVLI